MVVQGLWSENKTDRDIEMEASCDSGMVIANLLEDIELLKESMGKTSLSH